MWTYVIAAKLQRPNFAADVNLVCLQLRFVTLPLRFKAVFTPYFSLLTCEEEDFSMRETSNYVRLRTLYVAQ